MPDDQKPWPEFPAPLADFHGEKPPAPAWFDAALADAPERSTFTFEGADIELLTWGEIGKPGLLLLHGNGASADWWTFIAPWFAREYRVAAFSWSGMGRSDWRETYTAEQFAQESFAAAEAAGLYAAGKPVFVAHSFGGFPTMLAASKYGDQVRLGLPLAYRYCQLMGGTLSVQSKLGEGSTFTVTLPGPLRVVAEKIDASVQLERQAA